MSPVDGCMQRSFVISASSIHILWVFIEEALCEIREAT
jgi:hypothetical protein